MKPLLIQQASNEPYVSMLEKVQPIHTRYCRKHGFDYLTLFGHSVEPKSPHWNKIRLILNALNGGAQEVFWLDADCLIVDPNVNLTDGIPEGGFGMVVHRHGEPAQHFNSGSIYIRASNEILNFFNQVWSNWEANPAVTWQNQPWNDQSEIMKLNDKQPLITEIDARWNATENINPSPNPVVLSLHGCPAPNKLEFMESLLKSRK